MEQMAKLHIEKLPEGFYLATSEDIPGLVVQGRTVAETVEIARDVARKLLEAQVERHNKVNRVHGCASKMEDVFGLNSTVRSLIL